MWLRVAVGGITFALHGWARLGRLYSYLVLGKEWTFVALVGKIGLPVPPGFAVASALAESIGAILLILGLYTRWAAAILTINMGVATWFELSKGGAGAELPGLYLIAMLTILIGGPGAYSLDGRRRGGKKSRTAWK